MPEEIPPGPSNAYWPWLETLVISSVYAFYLFLWITTSTEGWRMLWGPPTPETPDPESAPEAKENDILSA